MEKELIMRVRPDGTIEIEAIGYQGKDCDVAKAFEQSLGIMHNEEFKQDYFQTPENLVIKVGDGEVG